MDYTEIRKYTTAQERMAIAARHGVKTRAGLSQILHGKRMNVPLLAALTKRAESNKAKMEALQERTDQLAK